jgi:hypothetical protein
MEDNSVRCCEAEAGQDGGSASFRTVVVGLGARRGTSTGSGWFIMEEEMLNLFGVFWDVNLFTATGTLNGVEGAELGTPVR